MPLHQHHPDSPDAPADLAIVGAGPIGLELHAAAKRMGLSVLHFDAHQIAHTISWYPRQVHFFSSPERIAIAGVPLNTPDQTKATREQYLAYLRSVVELFDLDVQTYQPVIDVKPADDGFTLTTRMPNGTTPRYVARRLVLATGDMNHPRTLDIPGEDLPHVSHYFEDPHPYFRKKLLVVGGKNSAVEAALRCHHAGAHVTIAYRRQTFDPNVIKYWLLPEIEMLLRTRRIEFHPNTTPLAISPDHVELAPTHAPETSSPLLVPADFVLLLTGYQADPALLQKAGVLHNYESGAPSFNLRTMETNVPGLYVAGTAAAGSQERFRLFIENCHSHVRRILTHVTGHEPQPHLINPLAVKDLPES